MKNKFYFDSFKNYLKGNRYFTNAFIIVSFVILTLTILFFNYFIDAYFSFNSGDYSVGEPAKKSYILKSDLRYFNEYETDLAKKYLERSIFPVYRVDDQMSSKALNNFKTFRTLFLRLAESDMDFELLKGQLEFIIPGLLSDSDLKRLLELDGDQLFLGVEKELGRILSRGVLSENTSVTGNGNGLISVLSLDENNTLVENISAISVLKSINIKTSDDENFNYFIKKFVNEFIVVNCFYDNEQTKFNKESLLDNVEPVIDVYREGHILIKKDVVVSVEDYKKIKQAEESIKLDTLSSIFLVIGYLVLLFISSFVLFNKSFVFKKLNETEVILITGFTLFYGVLSVVLRHIIPENISYIYPLVIPSVLISILTTFLLGNRVSFYLSVVFSFLILLISEFSIYAFSVTLIMSLLATIVVHDVEKRIDLIKSSSQLVVLQTLLVLCLIVVGLISVNEIVLLIIVSVVSAFISGILTLALLPLSEHFLRISTCFQLTELCDLNTPLLKSMLIKAPGTYAHSIAVANMSESAAQHIGANALLAKAGGYYHDIGKIDQPHYFIENQKGGKNLHDEMKPSLSVAVIKSHVKLGIEKGKNIGLPGDVIDIIEQHHGKGVISFFLGKAKKENKGTPVLNEDFAYSGPNPQSPESAIVMLADSVEAAVRSLKNPTISQLDKFVWELILNKLKEGMLDACGLTLSDLTTIKDSFINTLMGHYHSRIEYPADEDK